MRNFRSDHRHPAETFHQEVDRPKASHPLIRVLATGTVSLLVSSVFVAHAFDMDAAWRTESSLLFLLGTVVIAWTRPRWEVLVAAIFAFSIWCGIELIRDGEWGVGLIRSMTRTAVAAIFVAWTIVVRRSLFRARHFARIDSLTGLPNRQAILEALDAELCRTRRFGRAFSIAMLDCDGFKQINDRFGHLAGDKVLCHIADALRQQTRAYDCIGRLGGDEFVVVLSEANSDEIVSIIERLRAALRRELAQEYPDLTFSIGVVTIRAEVGTENPTLDLFDCLRRADEAMYVAKRAGRDQTKFETLVREATRSPYKSLE